LAAEAQEHVRSFMQAHPWEHPFAEQILASPFDPAGPLAAWANGAAGEGLGQWQRQRQEATARFLDLFSSSERMLPQTHSVLADFRIMPLQQMQEMLAAMPSPAEAAITDAAIGEGTRDGRAARALSTAETEPEPEPEEPRLELRPPSHEGWAGVTLAARSGNAPALRLLIAAARARCRSEALPDGILQAGNGDSIPAVNSLSHLCY